MKKAIIAFFVLIFLYGCSTINSYKREYNSLKSRIDALSMQIKTNSVNIKNNTLRMNSIEVKIMEIQKRLAKEREKDNFANKIPPISEIIGYDNGTSDNSTSGVFSKPALQYTDKQAADIKGNSENKTKRENFIKQASSLGKDGISKQNDNIDFRQYYKEAINAYMKRDYVKAESMFENFIARYRSNDLTDNAIFWLAHSYLHLGKNKKAVNEFKILVKNYPFGSVDKGGKTDNALYDLIKIYSNDKIKADYYKNILLKRFPMSKYAKIVRKNKGG